MKTINLTQGQVAMVDDADFDEMNQWKWCAMWNPGTKSFYAVRNTSRKLGKRQTILMHREILGLKYGDKRQGDHINHRTLINCRCNLRICSNRQNQHNRRKHETRNGKSYSSIYKGIYWFKRRKKWHARIEHNGKQVCLGYFTSEIEAARAYDAAAVQLFGDYAKLNFREAV